MRLPRFIVLVLLVASLGVPGAAQAQRGGPGRIRSAIEVTQRRIEQAEAVVSGSGDEQARLALDQARVLQARSRSAFGAGRYPMAARLTLEARRGAERALSSARGLPDPDEILVQLERTRDLLDRAAAPIRTCRDERARAMLQDASALQARAEAAGEGRRFLAAMQLTVSARERGLRALRLCNLDEDVRDAAERALRRTDEVLARARDRLQAVGPARGREALGRVVRVQDDAWRQYRDGRHQAALRLTLSARALARRAMREAGGAF